LPTNRDHKYQEAGGFDESYKLQKSVSSQKYVALVDPSQINTIIHFGIEKYHSDGQVKSVKAEWIRRLTLEALLWLSAKVETNKVGSWNC
jgi:hypothetical protein